MNRWRRFVPPIFIDWFRSLFPRETGWRYLPDGWQVGDEVQADGWSAETVLETYREKWPLFVRAVSGPGPLGVAHESSCERRDDMLSHNVVMSFGYVLGLAAQSKPRMSLLDWGGGTGHYYLFAQALFPSLELDYHCKDVASLARFGTALFPEAHFYDTSECLQRSYDLVMASASLLYARDWRALITELAGATGRYLYIANTPMVQHVPSFPFVQRHYATEYVGWCLNAKEVRQAAEKSDLVLVREFVYGYRPIIRGAPEQPAYHGFLFERRHSI